MSAVFFGHSYCIDPVRPMQTLPRIVESILEHFIDACEDEFWKEKQRDGFVSDANDLSVSRCIVKKTFVLQQVCKMWTCILRGNACINKRYLDIRRLFLANMISFQSKHLLIRQYDGAEMHIFAKLDSRLDSNTKVCFIEILRDCTLDSILPWHTSTKNTVKITILHEGNHFACQGQSVQTAIETQLDCFVPAQSFIVLQSCCNNSINVSLNFKANHTEALQHFLKKRKLND